MRKTHTEIHLRNEPEHGHKEYKYLYQQMLKEFPIVKDTTPNITNPRLYDTA